MNQETEAKMETDVTWLGRDSTDGGDPKGKAVKEGHACMFSCLTVSDSLQPHGL